MRDHPGKGRSPLEGRPRLDGVWNLLPRSIFTPDPLSPSPADGFGAAPLADGVAQLQRQYLGQTSIVQPLPHRDVAGAGTTDTGPGDPGALEDSVAAQRVKVESHRRRVQSQPDGEFGRVDRLVVLAHQFKDSVALPVATRAMRSPGLVLVVVVHPIGPLARLPSSYLEDTIH